MSRRRGVAADGGVPRRVVLAGSIEAAEHGPTLLLVFSSVGRP